MHRHSIRSPVPEPSGTRIRWGLLALAYAGLIIYGSLYPFTGWTRHAGELFAFLAGGFGRRLHAADALVNVAAYVPLGLLLAHALLRRYSLPVSVALAALAGVALSFAMESLQQFLPSRVASAADLLANGVGGLVGATLASVVRSEVVPIPALARLRRHWVRPGRLANLGLWVIAMWVLSQLTPLVPSIDIGELRHGIAPLWRTLHHPALFDTGQWGAYALDIVGLAILARTLALPGRPLDRAFASLVLCVLACKIAVVGRQLSLEAAAGALAGLLAARAIRPQGPRAIAAIAATLVACGFAVDELRVGSSIALSHFYWIPFDAQLEHPLIGIGSILDALWPAAALAYLGRYAVESRLHARIAVIGGLLLTAGAFALEWNQQFLQGRIGDITTVLLMLAAWCMTWIVPLGDPDTPRDGVEPVATSSGRRRHLRLAAGALAALATAGVSTALVKGHIRDIRSAPARAREWPRPDELPAAKLPHFNYAHPRLPHPSQNDLEVLRTGSPAFQSHVRARAARGDLEAMVLLAVIEPAAVDLDDLFPRLDALRFAGRGDAQVKPLALAYDWLHGRWTETQAAQLRDRLVSGCTYVVEVIRKGKLSPYNVILYNAPLQALMACTIALYGDDPRAEPPMRFTYDMWHNRVLPVWRQVMGQNGGWHEGAEYVGIGIGQAVYQLPAMWRSATGEDLFAAEPGLRGFGRFLVYRTRPDGTNFRWGDGAHFDRVAPDATPLALELHDAAAYALHPPPAEIVPSGWPWGPLNDPAYFDPSAISRLPLARVFDGIGMIVARSDWSPDATYVTFKAGDNFWSHEHLDQGAFTIYKGGALAIDSGFYGPTYGSDHHMNYAYQTIAHNTITVTDPDDTTPAPGRDKPRPIANDGGQRRVGSGWGVEAAPLDRAEWDAKRDTYHTGTLEKVFDHDGLVVALADITPAYTNAASGEGTFQDRTRRVERFWRVFGYDRVDDVIVVFDQVGASEARFRKRWLLHSIEEPVVTVDGFRVHASQQERAGHAGGTLTARVLLPERAIVNVVGGRGLQFLVDDRNYDENGTLEAKIAKLPPEGATPGAWRVEVSPPQDDVDDVFLVVLLPTLRDAAPPHRVRLLRKGARVGCEVLGPLRTTRWWFQQGRNSTEIEVDAGTEYHRYDVEGALAHAGRRSIGSVLERIRQWAH